jgi:hypothetical protein
VAPSHFGVREPPFLRDIEIDLIRDASRIVNDDPRTLIERIQD